MNNHMKKISVSFFSPCYNEEKNVGKLISDAARFLPVIVSEHEIIIIDDGSDDATAEIAHGFALKTPGIRVIKHEKNMGYAAALRTGFENSGKEFIFFMDGDNQFDITEISKLIPYLNDFDIVAGYRIKRKDNLMRRFIGKCFNLIVRFFLGLKVNDVNCAFKIFKKEVVKNIKLESSGSLVNAEILIKAGKMGYKLKEVGVNHYPRKWGNQTGADPGVIIRACRDLFVLRKKMGKCRDNEMRDHMHFK